MTECIQQEEDFYALYLGAARNALAAHPIPDLEGLLPPCRRTLGRFVERWQR